MLPSQLSFVWSRGLQEIDPADWQRLAGMHPMLDYQFLLAFEATACVGAQTGWMPYHLTAFDQGQLVAAIPCYLKTHSYGEYVFDWSWAEAYEQAGGQYYPKLISAIPFSPVTGPRLLIDPACDAPALIAETMLKQLQAFCQEHALSGAHLLFPDAMSADFCERQGWLRREGVQFRWENAGYADWDAFMAVLSRDKRKKIRQERQKVAQQGVTCRVVSGHDMTAQDLALFYQCYCQTYLRHHSSPYLTLAFFEHLQRYLPGHLQLFIASQHGEDVAASLCVLGEATLYGRYWGSLRDISCLHFELCYYQPQQFCIREQIRYFEGGAQGEHKLARGFVAYPTCSYHWLSHPDFHQSVARFLRREAEGMQQYVNELEERSPYKNMPDINDTGLPQRPSLT
ncbi:GNAT family N-acetyltransferase [Methylophilus sp. DW102]|uniref:GNAT family N-acetyltransferase n=1 Tax=Methylophilus sp. DW102 TaxID=3095607 RepID=UPI00308EBD79|nr:GNAT family N-acetyltransferase [Methylophilus sp. DW102]